MPPPCRRSALSLLLLLLPTVLQCSAELDPDGAGKACTAAGQCAPGYVCDAATNRCVTNRSAADGGTADGASDAHVSDASTPLEASAADGDAPYDGSVDATDDAPPPPIDADCASPTTYYRDQDGDGFGRDDETTLACSTPGSSWALNGGDCHDQNSDVFPGQPAYFGTGFDVGAGAVSFDYDCSANESGDPSQFGAAPSCGGLSLGNCSGTGFATTARSGMGVNALCGSTTLINCVSDFLSCGAQTQGTTQPKRCK